MKAMTQSEITALVGSTLNNDKNIDFNQSVVCQMKPKYGSPYTIECVGIVAIEKNLGKSTVLVKYKFEDEFRFMNWSQFNAKAKAEIQKQLV